MATSDKQADNVLKRLQKLSWRGIEVPCVSIDINFAQSHERREYLFRDDKIVESLGKDNTTFAYSIPFRNGITRSPWKSLATVAFPDWVKNCQDSTAGKLIDPIFGELDAKCVSFSISVDPTKNDGFDVNVEFVQVPIDVQHNALLVPVSIENVIESAKRLDESLTTVVGTWQEEPPAATVNPLDAISGLQRQIIGNIDKINAGIQDSIFRVDKVIEATEALADVKNWSIIKSARNQKDKLRQLEASNGSSELRIASLVFKAHKDAFSVAKELGMTYEDFRALNPRCKLMLKPGDVIMYIRK